MSSSEEDIVVAYWFRSRMRRKRKYWVHHYNLANVHHSSAVVTQELSQHESKFREFYRMSPESFHFLKNLVSLTLEKEDTHLRKAISPDEKLLITIRYLVTGNSFEDLSLQFYRGKSTISYIVHLTCAAIWSHLQPLYMPQPTEETWEQISKRYYELWNLPNCIGSLDGKHFRIQCSPNTGSTDYNYKGIFSIVLMALSDVDGLFTAIDVGDYGRNSDGAVFRKTSIGKLLQENKLKIPEANPLPDEANDNPFPYYFVADEAFPLQHNIMRPFPKRVLNDARRIFNFRLSRGRKSVECGLGMLTSKFRLFDRPIYTKRSNAVQTIKSAWLQNFIRSREGKFYVPQQFNACSVVPALSDNSTFSNNTSSNAANRIRNKLGAYFLKPTGAIPTQWRCVGLQEPKA